MGKKEKIKLGITAALALLLLFSAVNSIRGTKRNSDPLDKEQLSREDIALKPGEGETSGTEGLYQRLEAEAQKIEVIRNPFSTGQITFATPSSRGMYLSGILWDKEKPTAIINDNIVSIGDEIGNSTVVDIKQNTVILNDGSQDFELKLEQ